MSHFPSRDSVLRGEFIYYIHIVNRIPRRSSYMKVGIRKPSVRKSVSARTKGYATRSVKKAINPTYGKKGTGWVHDPKKAAYNKIYNHSTFSIIPSSAHNASKKTNELDSSYKSIPVHIDVPITSNQKSSTLSAISAINLLLILFLILLVVIWLWQGFLPSAQTSG